MIIFYKASREMIPFSLVCDHSSQCLDQSDEEFCVYPPCLGFSCVNKQCVPHNQACDRMNKNCIDATDEGCAYCGIGGGGHTYVRSFMVWDLVPDSAIIKSPTVNQYTFEHIKLNETCPSTHFRCPGSYCLPVYMRCNGVPDCPLHQDEYMCHTFTCPGFYRYALWFFPIIMNNRNNFSNEDYS